MAPITGQKRRWIASSSACRGGRPSSRWRRTSTITWTTVAIATTVIIADSIVDTIVSFMPATARTPRVLHSPRSTTARGTASQRRLRNDRRRTAPARIPAEVPRRLPSRSSIEKPSRSITGSPATVPRGSSAVAARTASIASARVTPAVLPAGSRTQTTAAVRWSADTAYPSRSDTSRRAAGLVSRWMIPAPRGVLARLVAEAIPGIRSSRWVMSRRVAIPSGVSRSGAS